MSEKSNMSFTVELQRKFGLGFFKADEISEFIMNKISAKDAIIEEKQTVIDAWHKAFGTTQLTHAIDRLEVSEWKVKKLEMALEHWYDVGDNSRLYDFCKQALKGAE